MEAERFYENLAHPTRRGIVKALAKRPRTFAELMRILDIGTSSKLAFHLARLEGFVAKRGEHYILTTRGLKLLDVIEMVEGNVESGLTAKPLDTSARTVEILRVAVLGSWAFSLLLYLLGIVDISQSLFVGYALTMIVAGKNMPLLIKPNLLYSPFDLSLVKESLAILAVATATFLPLAYMWESLIFSSLAMLALTICAVNLGGHLVAYFAVAESRVESYVRVDVADVVERRVKPGTNVSFRGRITGVRNATYIEAIAALFLSPFPRAYEVDGLKVVTPEYLPTPSHRVGDEVEVIGRLMEVDGDTIVASTTVITIEKAAR